ncbi:hypothetical protein ACOI1C_19380, partial [Bacillus sp. DJP31]|uniref:hypothetical protein n=1 Tax=Bacillus sp. DJP31 TaxID=3409789 RepID=UPI003BB5242A
MTPTDISIVYKEKFINELQEIVQKEFDKKLRMEVILKGKDKWMSRDYCFVMQPFDKGRFDKRYEEVFAPAIRSCDLEPYRVDRDPGVVIPIDDIEKGIRNSRICLAEITLDNPNVWFELGYAIACGKDVILVCSTERNRNNPFPFDVRH